MPTGAIEVMTENIEILSDIPNALPFLPSSKNLNVNIVLLIY